MKLTIRCLRLILLAILVNWAVAPVGFAEAFPWKTYAEKPDAWYRSGEGDRVTANVLSHQSDRGDWPKNIDTSATRYNGDRSKLIGTFDNGATVGEMRFLARAYLANGSMPSHDAFNKALDHVLVAQNPKGGWPQSFPPGKGYSRYVTFNDNTMVNILELLRDVARSDDFRFVGASRRAAAGRAFEAGIECILKCQIEVGGRLTVWCAQHDEETLEPRGARTFELPSLSGGESSGILLLLMSLDDPSPKVVRSVDAGARWFESSKLTGIRQVVVDGNRIIRPDRDAAPLWARFSEIETNRPFFCGRDGVKKYDVAEIEPERRNGYAWYGNWGGRVASRYAAWKEKWRDRRAEPRQ